MPLPRGRWGGASGRVAPAGRVSGVMFGQARARRASSVVVVQKAPSRSTSPVAKAARHPASIGSSRRCTTPPRT